MTSNSCNCSLNGAAIPLLSLIFGMIESQSWDKFGHAINSNPAVFRSIARTCCSSTQLNGTTM